LTPIRTNIIRETPTTTCELHLALNPLFLEDPLKRSESVLKLLLPQAHHLQPIRGRHSGHARLFREECALAEMVARLERSDLSAILYDGNGATLNDVEMRTNCTLLDNLTEVVRF
jgi:hypothetical protein